MKGVNHRQSVAMFPTKPQLQEEEEGEEEANIAFPLPLGL